MKLPSSLACLVPFALGTFACYFCTRYFCTRYFCTRYFCTRHFCLLFLYQVLLRGTFAPGTLAWYQVLLYQVLLPFTRCAPGSRHMITFTLGTLAHLYTSGQRCHFVAHLRKCIWSVREWSLTQLPPFDKAAQLNLPCVYLLSLGEEFKNPNQREKSKVKFLLFDCIFT